MVIQMPPNLPVGFRFHPTDVELITSYLRPKIVGKFYDVDAIAEVDFCESEPWELVHKSKIETKDRLWWFLCRKDYKSTSSKRAKRTTKKGFWKITGQEREIKDEDTKVCIGRKKTLVYYSKIKDEDTKVCIDKRTNWVMQEIYLDPNTFTIPPQMDSYVICRLKKKTDDNVYNPEREIAPDLEHRGSGSASASSSAPVNQSVNGDTQLDPGFNCLESIETTLTEDDIRFIFSTDTFDESPEDFADGLIVENTDQMYYDDKSPDSGQQTSLKRSYFRDGPVGSDTDAEGSNSQYYQTVESSNSFDPHVGSKKVRQMRVSKMKTETLQTSISSKHFVQEQTVTSASDQMLENKSSSDGITDNPGEAIFSISLESPKNIAVTGGNRQRRIQIQKSDLSSSSSSSSPEHISTVKTKEAAKHAPQKEMCIKESQDFRKVVEKCNVESRLKSATSEFPVNKRSSVSSFVETSSLSICHSHSPLEYWINSIVGSVLFLIFVRELLVFRSW